MGMFLFILIGLLQIPRGPCRLAAAANETKRTAHLETAGTVQRRATSARIYPVIGSAWTVMWGVFGFVAGAVFGGLVNGLVGQYGAFKESKGVALALQSEIRALLGLVVAREYITTTDQIITRLLDPTHVVGPEDLFAVRITQDYFAVFHALAPKIGSLRSLGNQVVLVYVITKSLLEDIAELRERLTSQPLNPAVLQQMRPELLYRIRSINVILRNVVQFATTADAELARFSNGRWLKLFR